MSATEIVVGVDGSASSAAALRWAAEQADLSGASLIVTYVYNPTTADLQVTGGFLPNDWEEKARERVRRWMLEAIDDSALPGWRIRVVHGSPGPALVEVSGHADLLVIGEPRHRRWGRIASRSASDYCVAHARPPVVLVPPVVTWSIPQPRAAEAGADTGFRVGPLH